jgi:hypothetical protein
MVVKGGAFKVEYFRNLIHTEVVISAGQVKTLGFLNDPFSGIVCP